MQPNLNLESFWIIHLSSQKGGFSDLSQLYCPISKLKNEDEDL